LSYHFARIESDGSSAEAANAGWLATNINENTKIGNENTRALTPFK